MPTVKAIIFDYYGVILANTHGQRLSRLWVDSPEKAEEFSSVNRAGDRGILTMDESRKRMAELLGITHQQLMQEYAEGELPNRNLLLFIEDKLKPSYKIGLLSNSTSRQQLDVRFSPGELDLYFEEIVSSGDIGFTKPQPEAYAYIAAKLGVLPEECIMIDDIAEYCQGARDAGMKSIQFVSNKQCLDDLRSLLDQNPIKV